ncbi:DUF4153 domain-containing protein [Yoonia sp. 2307UL14-13]|uniref:DUF4153 domain-containing protein n=1 Tax=Yoonia sp. 2307UL14-13 TaxID=3126506 RepID=UPI0030A41B89
MVIRGVPERLAKDGWWLDGTPAWRISPVWLLVGVVLCADLVLWGLSPGLGFVVWLFCVAAAAHVALGWSVSLKRAGLAWGVLVVAVLPAADLVQAVSVGLAVLGLAAFAVILTTPSMEAGMVARAFRRLPSCGALQTWEDALTARLPIPPAGAFAAMARDWLLPLTIGALFIGLLAMANPFVDTWIGRLRTMDAQWTWNPARITFWVLVAIAVWPMLRLGQMIGRLMKPARPLPALRSGLVTGRSMLRALVLFNIIFGVQTVLDASYLWGSLALPEGMTYAEYAHRGAYPLLVAALLAGGFALIAQPFLKARPVLRVLLYVWIGQTVLLVLSSILRLDLYVEAYGLTRLRFAAFIWMIVTALWLVLMIMQMVGRQSIGWFMMRSASLGLLALYVVSLVNVDGFIARHNLATGKNDYWYLCQLSEGAVVAIAKYQPEPCYSDTFPQLTAPQDWREWGFRNARLRRSLAEMNEVQG